MFDRRLRHWIDPGLDAVASRLAGCGLSANAITAVGFSIGLSACAAIAAGHYGIGLALVLVNRLADGLDGCVARRSQPTDVGGFLDIVLDTIFYAAVPYAFALADGTRFPAACFLIVSFAGTGGSFLAFAVIASKRQRDAHAADGKSFLYSVGLMEGSETVLFFVLFCLFPAAFSPLAFTFGSLCWLTTVIRVAVGCRAFRDESPTDHNP